MPNPVVHFEILGKDGAKLQQYYANLFGWEVNANNPMNYGMVAPQGTGIGGGITGTPDGQNGVCIYVAVKDIQGMLDKAVAMGGEVIMPVTEIPNMVTFAQFRDPQGNVMGLVKDDSAM
jgi:predicted enzyme related to lactoylglutathione lyase